MVIAHGHCRTSVITSDIKSNSWLGVLPYILHSVMLGACLYCTLQSVEFTIIYINMGTISSGIKSLDVAGPQQDSKLGPYCNSKKALPLKTEKPNNKSRRQIPAEQP